MYLHFQPFYDRLCLVLPFMHVALIGIAKLTKTGYTLATYLGKNKKPQQAFEYLRL
jgi:L-lactate utilization protein LutB